MTFRFLRWLHRRGVSRGKLKGSILHRWLGDAIFVKELWSFKREAVARGWLIGSVVGATPLLGLQLVMGLPLGLLCRANLFIVVALIFSTNPFTAAFFYPFAFMVGCHVLGRPIQDFHWDNGAIWKAGGPLFVGCAVIGILVGSIGYLLIRRFWKDRPILPLRPLRARQPEAGRT